MITAKIVADSISSDGKRITTFELEYPRMVHAELMTHRLFSRNAASSRAIPIEKMLDLVESNPACPEEWGKNQKGMQAKEVFTGDAQNAVKQVWRECAQRAVDSSRLLNDCELHKQIVNRVVEPFSHIKVVVTATEFDNWYWLRKHEDAQPEIRILAEKMYEESLKSEPVELGARDWHVPYYRDGQWFCNHEEPHSLEEALMISSSCCAQVSYRVLDESIDKARKIYHQLVTSKPTHASPFEHQARPMQYDYGANRFTKTTTWQEGVTHFHKELGLGSGNFYGWIQHRQLLTDHTCWSYEND